MANAFEHNLYSPRWVSQDQYPGWKPSEILPNLFMGGTADDDTIDYPQRLNDLNNDSEFDAVVTLYSWANPMSWGVEELRYGFGDGSMRHVDVQRLMRTARWAYSQWAEGKRVMIRCQAGLNRSGLITALVLMIDGYSAAEAITLIRQNRCEVALCNNKFVDWLVNEASAHIGTNNSNPSAA